ncbi:MAG: DNA alkylation repair protein [Planctomycetes bacterium]|nr:DNA alkylation repair protein [Planctomycetota bacterium]
MSPEQLAAELDRALRRHTNRERQAATAGYYPSAMENLGVYAADLRAVERTLRPALKTQPAAFVLRFVGAVLARNTLEGRQAVYELLAWHKAARESLDCATLEELGRGMDNWASVDCFSCELSGPAWREGRIKDSDIARWTHSRDIWWRRAALVSTVPLNLAARGGQGDTPRTLAVCERLAADREPMVAKASSWALRALVTRDAAAVREFLASHDNLPALVRREVTRKLTTGRKNG